MIKLLLIILLATTSNHVSKLHCLLQFHAHQKALDQKYRFNMHSLLPKNIFFSSSNIPKIYQITIHKLVLLQEKYTGNNSL